MDLFGSLKGKYLNRFNKNLGNFQRYNAFTLAEVLIVISIIGIIAVITIPTIVANVQKQTLANELKNGYAMLQAGFRKAMADDATDNFEDTTLFAHCNANPGSYGNNNDWRDGCAPYMSKYFINLKVLSSIDLTAQGDNANTITDTTTCNTLVGKTNKWWFLNDHTKCMGWKNLTFTFNNGMRADIALTDQTRYGITKPWMSGYVTLDVNGEQGPNTWGRDAFYFYLLPDGRLVGAYSKEFAIWTYLYRYGSNAGYSTGFYWPTGNLCSDTSTAEGTGCTGRLMDNNFVFDY